MNKYIALDGLQLANYDNNIKIVDKRHVEAIESEKYG